MAHARLSYVFLEYIPTSREELKKRIFVFINHNRASLEIFVNSGWDQGLKGEDRDYLAELIEDWSGTSSEEIPSLLEQLAGLSIGPLQAIESGILDQRKRASLIGSVQSGKPIH